MSASLRSKLLQRRIGFAIEGLVKAVDVDAMLASPGVARAQSYEQRKQFLAQWLRKRRLEAKYAVPEIDRRHPPFSDKAAEEYEQWDQRQAETILRRAGY